MANEGVLIQLREKLRNAQRAFDKAKAAGDRVAQQRYKREIERLTGEIENLK